MNDLELAVWNLMRTDDYTLIGQGEDWAELHYVHNSPPHPVIRIEITSRPNEAERLKARDEALTALEQDGKLRYCQHCGEFVILVAGKWEADGLSIPICYDMTARLTCERSSEGHKPSE